eukprot:UN23792
MMIMKIVNLKIKFYSYFHMTTLTIFSIRHKLMICYMLLYLFKKSK